MQKTCTDCGAPFDFSTEEQTFIEKMSFTFGSTVIHPVEPRQCPTCRMVIRVSNRNENNLHRNVSAVTGKPLISIYAPEPLWGEPYKVYTQDEWNADEFDPIVYGRDVDLNRPFFEQYAELTKAVPHMAVVTMSNENSDYTTGTAFCKNCYLLNSSENCEDCMYGKLYQTCNDVLDSAYMYDSELCYSCFSLYNCSRCTYVSFSKNSHDCLFSSNLQGCKNCCLCTNLTQKEYYFRNQPLSKEEYEKRVAEVMGSHATFIAMSAELANMMQQKTWKYANIVDSEHSTGDYLEHCQNCTDCYDVDGGQDCRYLQVGGGAKDCWHSSNLYLKPQLYYETLGSLEGYNCAYCLYVFYCQNMLYCEQCYTCKDCFGCFGLKRKQYCIFNKQYTQEEYERLVPQIIEKMKESGEWGLFFPPRFSPFGYNESVAQEYEPKSETDATSKGFYWRAQKDDMPQVKSVIPAADLPDNISDVTDDILDHAISCAETGRPFRIQKPELDFYRNQQIPLPRLHPVIRYEHRMRIRNPRHLYMRQCMKCSKEIQTTFAPERPETVYCEQCYLEAVY